MNKIATTKMSSKGQVVIPKEIRDVLHLETGTKFVVVGEGNVVVLKAISPPGTEEFEELILRAQQAAYDAGMTSEDIQKAINEVRSEK